ncbi:MAG TPA: response regulator transcription factor [Sphingobium sp.]|nr:response regulator transcription factor [Sphingobium sp.]
MTTSDVVLVGSNSIAREGLRRLLSEQHRQVVHSVGSLDKLASHMAGDFLLLLIEDKRSEWDGKDLAAVHQRFPAARIAILAVEFDYHAMLEAFRAGAEGYLTNDVSWERLIGYLDLIALGEKIFPSQLAQKLLEESLVYEQVPDTATVDSANLSARELEILQRLISGLPNKVISRQLSISEATVKVHVKAVLRKLRVANRTQAAIWATAQGMQGMDSGGEAAPARLPAVKAPTPLPIDPIPFRPGGVAGGPQWASGG